MTASRRGRDAFASDEGECEGEGDRTRSWWLDAHRQFFGAQAAREGFAMSDRIVTVFEKFAVVWPARLADQWRVLE